jgi:hypothetical protein
MFPRQKKFKVMSTAVKIMATVFKDEGWVLILNFLLSDIISEHKDTFKNWKLKFN